MEVSPIECKCKFLHKMKDERARLKTFEGVWPHSKPTPEELVHEGFFYIGFLDKTQCAFCEGIIYDWKERDIPGEEHAKHFPFCPLVMSMETGNIPMRCTKLIYKWHYFLKIGTDYILYSESSKEYDSFQECLRKGKRQIVPWGCQLFFSETEVDCNPLKLRVHYFGRKPGTNEMKLYLADKIVYTDLDEMRHSKLPSFDVIDSYGCNRYFTIDV